MAAHFIVIACLIAEPHTCSEIQVPEAAVEDVISCNHQARQLSEKWQADHKDQYLVIATKCVKAEEGATGNVPGSDGGKTGESSAAPSGGEANKPAEQGNGDTPRQ
jgi:hypothetical protein